jgi:catechol-2,3-dioxygenase
MATSGLLHIALKTPDLKKTEQFYTEILGLEVAFRVPPNMIFLRTPGANDLLNFVRDEHSPSANSGLEHFGFKTSKAGLKEMEARLKENGVALAGRRGENAIYISDPNGYQLEFYCD